MNLKSARPGRYRPRCPNCAKPFLLWIPEGPGSATQVRPVPTETRVHERASVAGFALPCPSEASDPAGASGAGSLFDFAGSGAADERSATRSPGPGSADEPPLPPKTEVRGYTIERELGRGGMGTVYLATQLSLDRPVALKVMSRRWATDPVFVARFTREAFAAAQLAHPNIVQIHDIGEADGAHFFSMEYVRGRSLSDLIRSEGKLDPETAVGYTLQAARGLKHAHDRGMIHRDVKPDNLLLDTQGVIKVADLGLVKTPAVSPAEDRTGSSSQSGLHTLPPDMTGARIALGTPAYMSPEQCRDAASVDHRADIYSLGCTLYVLVTGRPPFDGTTAVELMSKHAYDPLVPPEQIVSRVPKEVSSIIQRMMAKSADDRYQDMGEVIRTLEAWLGVRRTGTFSPHEDQISRLETSVLQFNSCGAAVLRGKLISGFFGAIALVAVLLAFFGKIPWAFGTFALALEATLAYFVIDGVTRKGHLFSCTQRFLGGLGAADWAIGLSALALFCILLALLNVLWIWVGFGFLGFGLALVLRYTVDRALADERRAIIDGCERQLRRMRTR
ncbi:MAG TPA: protein kinase, partial [Gemmata sp.]